VFRLTLAVALLSTMAVPGAEPARGEQMLDAYFRNRVKQISDHCLSDVRTTDEWEKQRPELRRQFLDMLGLWPLPDRGDLKAMTTGKIDGGSFVVEKLVFQSRPGLYVTGNLYVPKNAKALPAVLYVCGHGNVVKDGVSFGSKVFYQHHPTWFAQNGYVCLVLDTLELGEIPGDHHGTSRRGDWWWQALGYTPAGVECWNAVRALDYLETRPEVDPKRIGVTGRSGGGATSWWVAAADDRVRCIVPVAGIADLHAHLIEGEADRYKKGGVIAGHCDCMYMVNTYQWDFPLVAALCAPRPLMLGNSDADQIFPVAGYRPMAQKVRKIYDLYGAGEKFVVLETPGPHKDTPELRLGAFRWLNHWLKKEDGPVVESVGEPFTPEQLKVLDRPPADATNPKIQESFVARAKIEMPDDTAAIRAWWVKKKDAWKNALKSDVFRGWPKQPPALGVKAAADLTKDGLRLQAFDFTSEDDVELRVWLLTAAKVEKPKAAVLAVVDETGFRDQMKELGPTFADAFPGVTMPARDDARYNQTLRTLEHHKWAFATIAPRGVGPTKWAEPGSPADVLVRRRFALIGQTLDGQRVWDVRRAISVLTGRDDLKNVPLWLQGKGEIAGIVLHAAIFEPEVKRLDLWHLPTSHRQGPTFLNVLRHFDMPQALALAAPTPVHVYVQDETEAKAWEWAARVTAAVAKDTLTIRTVGD
jgi:dienelactone hydrolase